MKWIDEAQARRGVQTLERLAAALPAPPPEARFHVDQDAGQLQIRTADGRLLVRARAAVVGTYSTRSDSWLWAWANPTAAGASASDSNPRVADLPERGRQRGWSAFGSARVPLCLEQVEGLFGLALELLEAEGWYRFDLSPTSQVHLALWDIECVDRSEPSRWLADGLGAAGITEREYHRVVAAIREQYAATGRTEVLKLALVEQAKDGPRIRFPLRCVAALFQKRALPPTDPVLQGALGARYGSRVRFSVYSSRLAELLRKELERSGTAHMPGLGTFRVLPHRIVGTDLPVLDFRFG